MKRGTHGNNVWVGTISVPRKLQFNLELLLNLLDLFTTATNDVGVDAMIDFDIFLHHRFLQTK